MDQARLGAFIAGTRRELNMTQRDLAERLHVTDKAVSKWERGGGYPDVTLLEPLAAALGLGVEELVACRRQGDGREEEPVRNLLDISGDSVRRERRRSRGLAGALALAVLAALVVFHCSVTVTEQRSTDIALKETADGENYLYVPEGGRLLQLRCGPEVDYDAIRLRDDRGDPLVYRLDCRWDRRTCRGTVRQVEAAGRTGIRPQNTVGSVFGLDRSYETGDALFGLPDVSCEITACYPDRYGPDMLTSYAVWAGDGAGNWAHRRLLDVEDCLSFAAADVDGDGEQELAVRTRWPEKPYTVYDMADGEITETWPDAVSPELAERLLTDNERYERLQAEQK